jgi:hypothetical protein
MSQVNSVQQAMRERLQMMGAQTHDPGFTKSHPNTPMAHQTPHIPFVQPPNPVANVPKLQKHKLVLYSPDRVPGALSSDSNFRIKLAHPVDDVVKVELRSFLSPNGIYNITFSPSITFQWTWTGANSPFYTNIAPVFGIPVPTNQSLTTLIYLNNGSYSPTGLMKELVSKMNDNIAGMLGDYGGGTSTSRRTEWITGQVNAAGRIELYSEDLGLVFGFTLLGVVPEICAILGIDPTAGGGTITAVATGSPHGTTDYYWLIFPNRMNLPNYQVICVRSQAFGNKLIATQGNASGLQCFTTVPIGDGGQPIKVILDNNLDSTYFNASQTAYNTLDEIDITITDLYGRVIDLLGNPVVMEFDVITKVDANTKSYS